MSLASSQYEYIVTVNTSSRRKTLPYQSGVELAELETVRQSAQLTERRLALRLNLVTLARGGGKGEGDCVRCGLLGGGALR